MRVNRKGSLHRPGTAGALHTSITRHWGGLCARSSSCAVGCAKLAGLAYSTESGSHPPSDACKLLFAAAGVEREGGSSPFTSLSWFSGGIKGGRVPALGGGITPRPACSAPEDDE